MSGFVLGLIIGGYAGAVGTLALLLIVHSIPDGDSSRASVRDSWNGVGPIVALMIASGVIFSLLNLHRVAFATSALLLLVFAAAHMRGMLVSWITLAIAVLTLCVILPPTQSLSVSDPQDQILLAFFIICGTVGTRLIAQNQKA